MAASFPNAKKTFSSIVNGITEIVANHWNWIHDEVEAIETMLGAMGSTQANTDSYKNLLKNMVRGCEVEYKGAADLYVRAGEIAIPDASGNLRFRTNAADITVDWTMIDTGAEAGSTIYYVYAIADAVGTGFTVKITLSATAPASATFYKKLGCFYNNASSNIEGVTDLIRKVSDTGWFAVAVGTLYTRTHNLGVNKVSMELQFSTTADGSSDVFNIGSGAFAENYGTGFQIEDVGLVTVGVRSNDTHLLYDEGGAAWVDSGYLRVLLKVN